MTTPIEILQLEKAWGLKFTRLNEEEFREEWAAWNTNKRCYYVTNDTNHVWGLIAIACQITDITAFSHLIQLQKLHLRDNQITDITPLAQLNQLNSLNLDDNQISDITALAHLTQLLELKISDNQITDITALAHLTQLQHLYLMSNQISDITALAHLTQLQYLYLISNQITDITALAHLTQLQHLYLSFNQINDITALAQLNQLQDLSLGNNQITDVNELSKLGNLTRLELCKNHLRHVDQLESICELKFLYIVDFSGNPELPLEQEIITDIDKLRARFKDSKQGTTPHRNVKLLFLGDGCAGKSTLYSHLKEGKATHIDIHDRTDGIALNSWQNALPNVIVNIWDFGGQDIFHGTHRLFLGQRAIYVLLYTKTELKHCSQDDTHPLRYWLDFIADYGKGSRVLLVENVINDEFHSHFPDDFTLTELVKRYKQKGIYLDTSQYRFDCKHDTTGVNKFKNVLETEIETLLKQYPIQDYPLSWHLVQSALEEKKQTQSTLSMTEYDHLCNQHQISNPLALLEYFSQTGVVSYYKDLYQDKIILQTHWVLNAVYKAISIKDPNPLKSTNGKLNDDDFQKIWQDYATEEQALFKSYLLKSGLMTELRSNYHPYPKKIIRPYRYLMPSLFSKVKTADKIIWTEKQRYFSIEFPFMYGAIIQRLQVAILAHCHQEEEESFYQNYISLVDHNHSRGTVEVVENEMKIWAETAELYGKIFHELNEIYPLERTTIYENQQTQRKKIEYSKQQIGTISIAQGFTQQPLFMINFTKTANYLSLVDKLKQNKAVFFLGTGVSAYTTQNASLATWKGLLTHGIDYCQSIPIQGCDQDWVNSKKKDLSRDDIEEWLSVAAILTSKLETNTHFKTWLRKSVGSLQPLRKELIEEIGKLNAPIFTTNYDNLIEDILKYPHITNRQSDKIQEVLNDNRKAVVHLHGHYDDAESVILGIRSYQDLTNNTFFQELEKAISLSKHIVYVGYGAGLEDPNFGKLLKWSKQNIDSEHHQYRLVLEKDAYSFTQDRKIQNIVYGKTYDDILTFFQELNRDIS